MKQVVANNRTDIAFIYAGTAFHDSRKIMVFLRLAYDLCLVWGRNLGIRDNEGRQEGVRFFTFLAEHTHNAHADWAGRYFEGAVIIGMHAEASRTATRACKLMKLEVSNNRVINFTYFFRHRVEIRQKKSYHSLVGRHQPLNVWAGGQPFEGWGSCFFICYPNIITYHVKRIIRRVLRQVIIPGKENNLKKIVDFL